MEISATVNHIQPKGFLSKNVKNPLQNSIYEKDYIMEKWKKKAVELLEGLAISKSKSPSVITPYPSKTDISKKDSSHLRRATLKSADVSPRVIENLLRALEDEKRANLHNIIIVKGGKVICEASHPGYDINTYHLSHSMSKTVVGLAAGLLYDRGELKLSQPVHEILEKDYEDKRFSSITVENLLTMTSGVPFSEIGVATSVNWTDDFFGSSLDFEPGTKFAYNSMNSYILGKVVSKISGKSLTELITPAILAPLGIDNFFWEMGPEGVEKGGFGIYMSCESWAKVGLLILNRGVYNGERIISEEWLDKSLVRHSQNPSERSEFDYGYHIWLHKEKEEYLLSGMLGQNVWICPKNDIIVAINSGNNELFQDSPALKIIREHLSEEIAPFGNSSKKELNSLEATAKGFMQNRHFIKPLPYKTGILERLGIKPKAPFDTAWEKILGTYAIGDNNSGILPLFVSVMQSNYSGGIKEISLTRDGNSILFSSKEGLDGAERKIKVGLYDFEDNVVDFNGEKYIVRAMGEAIEDEDRNPIFKLELIFPELPDTRIMKFHLDDEKRLIMRLSERPDENIATQYMETLVSGGKASFVLGILEKKMGSNFITKKINEVFNPTLKGINTNVDGWEEILGNENIAETERRENTTGFLTSIIYKLIGDDRDDKAGTADVDRAMEQGFFKRAILGLFESKKRAEDDAASQDQTE